MLISIYGSASSGSSTLAIKLARELSEKKKNVIVCFSDYYTPTFCTFFPSEEDNNSLGELLTADSLSREYITKNLNIVGKNKYISFLSYKQGETVNSYPKYTEKRIEELLIHLSHMADVVIFDIGTNILEDDLGIKALERSDKVIMTISADLKGLSYYNSIKPLMNGSSSIKGENHIRIINNTSGSNFEDIVSDEIGGAEVILPYVKSIKGQYFSEESLKKIPKGRAYEKKIKKLLKSFDLI